MRMPPRRLTVLASIDVAGYTRLVEADERGTLAELATIRLKVMRPTLATYNGNLFKTMGDGALIEFNSVEDGVRWGLEFQMAMRERNAKREKPVNVGVSQSTDGVPRRYKRRTRADEMVFLIRANTKNDDLQSIVLHKGAQKTRQT